MGEEPKTYLRATIGREIEFEGRGLHSGVPVRVFVRPGEQRIRFRLGDEVWSAVPSNVTDTTRCTRLCEISTIEHMMSALAGAEITDAEIEVTAPELPAMDGSAAPYFEALQATGRAEIGEAEAPQLFKRVFVPDGKAKISISAGTGRWRYEFHTGERWPGLQIYESHDIVDSYPEIAPARTFGFEEELPMIRAAGLAKGLDESSALVLGKEGYLNGARRENEPVLHKMLDTIGDLYLAGIPIRFLNVVAARTGHTAAVRAAAFLETATRR